MMKTTPWRAFWALLPVLVAGCGSGELVAGDDEANSVAEADLQAVGFVSPSPGAVLSGVVRLLVDPPSGSTRVNFFVDNTFVGDDRDGAPWEFTLDTTRYADGVHELKATARNTENKRFARSAFNVTFANAPRDAGVVPIADAGQPVHDAGTPRLDAGTPPRDAGAPPDAGPSPTLDAGTSPTIFDAGTTTPPVGGVLAQGIWISKAEILALPMSGAGWNAVKSAADQSPGTPVLSNQDQMNNVLVLAKALVFVRTGTESYRTQVRQNCMAAIDTELGGRTLALGRELAAYVIAADLVGLDPVTELPNFRKWLVRTLTETLSGMTLISTHEDRPNNWGTHAGASRAAVAAFLSKSPVSSEALLGQQELARTAKVFKGWLGDRGSYAGFSYGDLSWQADASNPVGINKVGATKNGANIDGAFPDDMRRGCGFAWPPCFTDYAWEAFEGATVQAEILYRAGYDTWNWENQALLRAAKFLQRLDNSFGGWWAGGDDTWNPWLISYAYGTALPRDTNGTQPGKNMGWTDWTHDRTTRPRR